MIKGERHAHCNSLIKKIRHSNCIKFEDNHCATRRDMFSEKAHAQSISDIERHTKRENTAKKSAFRGSFRSVFSKSQGDGLVKGYFPFSGIATQKVYSKCELKIEDNSLVYFVAVFFSLIPTWACYPMQSFNDINTHASCKFMCSEKMFIYLSYKSMRIFTIYN